MSPHWKIILAVTALAQVGVTAVVIAYEAEIRPIRAKVLAGGRIAETAAGQVEYTIAGTGKPLLIVSCSDDLFHTRPAAEYAAAHIPGARLVVYPTGGHLLIGHSADVQGAVRAFLEQVFPDGPAAPAARDASSRNRS